MPLEGGYTLKGISEFKKLILNTREWTGAKALTKVAVLSYQNGLILRGLKAEKRDGILLHERLSHYQDIDSIFIEDTKMYKKYSVLIAHGSHVSGISAEIMEALQKYVSAGGVIVNLNAKWSISPKPDMSEEKDLTSELTGVSGNGQGVRAGFKVAEKPLGKGKIVTIHNYGIIKEIGRELQLSGNNNIESGLAAIIEKYSKPEIKIIPAINHPDQPRVKIMNVLKKNNWVGIALYSDNKTPASAKVAVDLTALGLKHDGYRLLLLGREAELLTSVGNGRFWTAENFKNGVTINILANNDLDKDVPAEVKLTKWQETYPQRTYEYEIMVITPSDELTMDGEKIQ